MATLPNFQTALLNLVPLFAPLKWQTTIKQRFSENEMRHQGQQQHLEDLIDILSDAFGLTRKDEIGRNLKHHLLHFLENLDAVAIYARSFGADNPQILWEYMVQDVVPGLGRTWGFWCRDEPIMPDMPGGDIWFLPRPNPDDACRLVLPVATVARWWRDLLGGPLQNIWPDATDDRLRSFQNWASGKTTPDITKLLAWFPDNCEFTYEGTFEPESGELATRFEAACTFLKDAKGLDPEAVAANCPRISRELAARALDGAASPHEQQIVVDAVSRRWSPPATRTVRMLFLIARALEQGYKELVAALMPGVNPHDADPMRNKALQLVELFRLAWLHTVRPEPTDFAAADEVFCQTVPGWLATGPFFSIMPGRNGPPPAEQVAAFLTERFKGLTHEIGLSNIFADRSLTVPAKPARDEVVARERTRILDQLNAGFSAWGGSGFDRKRRVGEAISELRVLPCAAEIEADIRHLEALDHLAHGSFDEAGRCLEDALALCKERSFGERELRIARDAFAFAAGCAAFNTGLERYFRVFSRSLSPEEVGRWQLARAPFEHSLRLAAREMSERFWRELVRPYDGVSIEHPLEGSSDVMRDYFALALRGAEGTQVTDFLRKHKPVLRRKLRDISGDAFFGMIAKATTDLMPRFQWMGAQYGGTGVPAKMPRPAKLAKNLRRTFLSLTRMLPTDMLNRTDYKNQTALILAADSSDEELVRILLGKKVDLDVQDTLGLTALHAAAKRGATQCFKMILKAGANPGLRTCDGNTPAMIAAQFGRAEVLELCLKEKSRAFADGDIVRVHALVSEYFESYDRMRADYELQGQRVGPRLCYQKIMEMTRAA